MARQVQFRRGTTSEHSTFTGAAGEITVDTDKDVAVVHDGSTAGGFPLVRQLSDLSVPPIMYYNLFLKLCGMGMWNHLKEVSI